MKEEWFCDYMWKSNCALFFYSVVVHIRSKIKDRLFHVNLAAHAPNLLLAIEPRCVSPTSLRLLQPPCACSDLAPTSLRLLWLRWACSDLAAHAPKKKNIKRIAPPLSVGFLVRVSYTSGVLLYLVVQFHTFKPLRLSVPPKSKSILLISMFDGKLFRPGFW